MNTHNHFPIDYYAYNSAIRNWNTGYKLLFATGAIITVITADSILISIYTFIFMVLVLHIYILQKRASCKCLILY